MEMCKDFDNKIDFSNIVIGYNPSINNAELIAKEIYEILKHKNISSKIYELSQFDPNATFAIIVGGDGTLLNAARYYAKCKAVIFGVNLGRLGFLAQSTPANIAIAIDKILDNDFVVEKRLMLSSFDDELTALNDLVIKGEGLNRTSRFNLYINGKLVCSYLADGLIISTPTGSTAYTLSAGGPVLVPSLEAIIIVPICPHTLNARPLVIPADDVIEISNNDIKSRLNVCADGQMTMFNEPNSLIKIEKYRCYSNILLLNNQDENFYTVLRDKLHWGIAPQV